MIKSPGPSPVLVLFAVFFSLGTASAQMPGSMPGDARVPVEAPKPADAKKPVDAPKPVDASKRGAAKARADAALNNARAAFGAQSLCMDELRHYEMDLKATERRLIKEFKSIPSNFNLLFATKRTRIDGKVKICNKSGEATREALRQAEGILRSVEPPSLPWVPAKLKELADLYAKLGGRAKDPTPRSQ